MKKFISMVMAAAMVVSLVPATAFAANTASFSVAGDLEWTEEQADARKNNTLVTGPEVLIKLTDVDSKTGSDSWKITLDFENAEVANLAEAGYTEDDAVAYGGSYTAAADEEKIASEGAKLVTNAKVGDATTTVDVEFTEDVFEGDDSVKLTIVENTGELEEGDTIRIPLSGLYLALNKEADATVTVSGKFGDSDAMTFVAVLEEGIDVTLKKVAEVAEEEVAALKSNLVIETTVSKFVPGQVLELKLNNGFAWDTIANPTTDAGTVTFREFKSDKEVAVFDITGTPSEITFAKATTKIEAVDAKVGDVATITVKVKEGTAVDAFSGTVTVDAVEVIGETVTLSVEEDEDVPVIYSGVKADNYGINDDSNHKSLEVTIKESVPGALDVKKDMFITLTEGVFVTDATIKTDDNVVIQNVSDVVAPAGVDFEDVLAVAAKEADQKGFEIDRKTFKATDDASINKEMELTFDLTLIAVPGFEGDVELTLSGAGLEEDQTVTIAKFVSPYKVEAAQNDLIIDYRDTKVPTDIVVTEAEAGLWNKSEMEFYFDIEKMEFEDDATFVVNEESEMEISDKGDLGFTIDKESDDEAAVITISDISLYMGRSLAAGAYDLKLGTSAGYAMMTGYETTVPAVNARDAEEYAKVLTAETGATSGGKYFVADFADWDVTSGMFDSEYATVKEGFVNVITAGRDQDDASFTKKVVVPVGESYIVAGEDTVTLDVPAYVSAAGYTMLPVRAVAVALGINTNNVLWDQATKTVTILYGQRIITMTVGSKAINVNGSAIPASASPEVVDGRTFLPMRDLATALGVTDITWDAATKTATLNGNK